MKEDTRTAVKHEFEHAAPTVIHDPEQDMTVLARWLHRGMAQGAKFWYLLGGAVVAIVVLAMLANGLAQGRSSSGRAWTELNAAQTPSQKIEVADAYPKSQVALLARLQAAAEYFYTATRDLPANREAAMPQLQKALETFRQVEKDAPHDSPEALTAAMGIARTLEARNELPEAIDAYKAVASGWPKSAEARQAQDYAARLADPEVVAFYKELYTYKVPSASLPGGLPADHPPLNGPTVTAAPPLIGPSGSDLLKDLTRPVGSTLPALPGPSPADLPPPPGLAPEAPAAKEAAPAPAKSAELPKDVFAPATKPKS